MSEDATLEVEPPAPATLVDNTLRRDKPYSRVLPEFLTHKVMSKINAYVKP